MLGAPRANDLPRASSTALELIGRGAPFAIAMPAAVIGPGDRANLGVLQRMHVRGCAPALTIGGGARRSQVHVDDCAEGIALVAERGSPGESYFLAAGDLSCDETYAVWATTPGGMKPLAAVPRSLALPLGAVAGAVQRWFGLPNLLSSDAVRGASAHSEHSGEKARRELGWKPGNLKERWLQPLAEERRRAAAPASVRRVAPSPSGTT